MTCTNIVADHEVLVEQIDRLHPKRLRCMPQSQEGDVLLPTLHAADVSSINAHKFGDGFLAEAGLQPQSANVFSEQMSNVHL